MAKPKTTWPPCARCGTPDGQIPTNGRHRTPLRVSGAQFGLEGSVCAACYMTLRKYPNAKVVPARHVPHRKPGQVRACRVCGCTEADCRQCIEKTGQPCVWVAATLCSACEGDMRSLMT